MSVHLIAACRSAVAPRGGALATLSPHDLAAPVVQAALAQSGLAPRDVDEVIVSNALGEGGNPARRVALAAGLPETIAGLSIDRQCAGGMDAVLLARMMVLSGAAEVVIAGGTESFSRRPLRAHTFADGRPSRPYAQAPFTPWPDRDPDMAEAAASLAQAQGITREDQDNWAMASHRRALKNPPLGQELVALKGLHTDPFARKLTPALCARAPQITGSVTAANAAVEADGAAFCVVVSDAAAKRMQRPTTRILGGATLGSAPTCPGLGPLPAIAAALKQAGLRATDLNVAEVMEAYAVQAIACVQGAEIDPDIVNLGGGALARGHPIGASGAVNVVRLHHELLARGGTGLATIAAAGGIGSALILAAR